MRFRKRQSQTKLPEINLVPMLDVLMTVLTFFILLSILLGKETLIDVQQPVDPPTPQSAQSTDPFIVELIGPNEIRLNGEPIAPNQLEDAMVIYLNQHPTDSIFLLPNPDLPYEQVMQFLGDMRQIGGDRVSLALEGP